VRSLLRFFAPALAALASTSVLACAGTAVAQAPPIRAVSDAIYLGARAEPGGAWSFAYDLDILVSDASTGISLGPSFSVSFAGQSGTDQGQRQEYLLACDFLRARISVVQWYGLRIMALVGAGMTFVSLYEQASVPHTARLEDGTEVVVSETFPSLFAPGALLTLGAGADWYWDANWGLAAYVVSHIRLDDQPRMPALWIEVGIGLRFGQ
jgi:hypothetical protein